MGVARAFVKDPLRIVAAWAGCDPACTALRLISGGVLLAEIVLELPSGTHVFELPKPGMSVHLELGTTPGFTPIARSPLAHLPCGAARDPLPSSPVDRGGRVDR
ncbi:MAG: hypothetical protein KBD01_00310 [Acidobacteria bacterium]|nr:hypothetical protein [Acidobacteriota bacterium]